jgi:hypothetical protein
VGVGAGVYRASAQNLQYCGSGQVSSTLSYNVPLTQLCLERVGLEHTKDSPVTDHRLVWFSISSIGIVRCTIRGRQME